MFKGDDSDTGHAVLAVVIIAIILLALIRAGFRGVNVAGVRVGVA